MAGGEDANGPSAANPELDVENNRMEEPLEEAAPTLPRDITKESS